MARGGRTWLVEHHTWCQQSQSRIQSRRGHLERKYQCRPREQLHRSDRDQPRPQGLEFVVSKVNARYSLDHHILTGLHANVITPLHVLNQAHTTGLFIAPSGSTARTLGQGTNSLVPLPATLNALSFEVVSTGETEEFLSSQHLRIARVSLP